MSDENHNQEHSEILREVTGHSDCVEDESLSNGQEHSEIMREIMGQL